MQMDATNSCNSCSSQCLVESTGCQGQLPSLEVGCCDLLNLLIAAEQTELVGHVRGTLKVSDACQDAGLHSA